jgi:uncharacterized membrane protein YGL010W
MAEKNIQTWLAEYSESHRNKTNKAIHWVCVPLIFLTIVAFLWALPTPEFFNRVPYLNFASLGAVFIVLFYIRLSVEGKKPSFFKDIQFLMIGPAWVMAFIMRKIGVKY